MKKEEQEMTTTDAGLELLNSLLRGELAATETYQQALAKMEGTPHEAELRRIHADHRAAANTIRQHINKFGGDPVQGSGAWGAWAKLVEGTAKIFGQSAALSALREGEAQGSSDYRDALKNEDLSPECKELIRGTLLPQTRDHLATLDRLMAS